MVPSDLAALMGLQLAKYLKLIGWILKWHKIDKHTTTGLDNAGFGFIQELEQWGKLNVVQFCFIINYETVLKKFVYF